MTYSGDFNQDAEFDAPSYPTVFGLTMTPMISGILLGLAGLGGAGAILVYLVSPAWENYQALDNKVKEKAQQLQDQDRIRKEIKNAKDKLAKTQKQRDQVYALFANQKSMNTLLFDLNQLIEKNNAGVTASTSAKLASCPPWVREFYETMPRYRTFEDRVGPLAAEAKLSKFTPNEKGSEVITDSSLGAAINNKLKRQAIEVEFTGNFNQTQSIFRTIERLQPLLVLKNLDVKVGGGSSTSRFVRLYEYEADGRVRFLTNCQPDTQVTTSFRMEALLPLTEADKKLIQAVPVKKP
jgi:type IV pilus assembly protein PilO